MPFQILSETKWHKSRNFAYYLSIFVYTIFFFGPNRNQNFTSFDTRFIINCICQMVKKKKKWVIIFFCFLLTFKVQIFMEIRIVHKRTGHFETRSAEFRWESICFFCCLFSTTIINYNITYRLCVIAITL